jgi:hypothetical protein
MPTCHCVVKETGKALFPLIFSFNGVTPGEKGLVIFGNVRPWAGWRVRFLPEVMHPCMGDFRSFFTLRASLQKDFAESGLDLQSMHTVQKFSVPSSLFAPLFYALALCPPSVFLSDAHGCFSADSASRRVPGKVIQPFPRVTFISGVFLFPFVSCLF